MLILPLSALMLQSHGWARRYALGNGNHASVVVNGQRLHDRAVIRDNRVLVPMAPIFEALGADVRWYPETQKVVAHKNGQLISLIVGRNFAHTPKVVLLDYPPRIMHGRIMVPLRFVAETLGAHVGWEQRAKVARVDLPMRRTDR